MKVILQKDVPNLGDAGDIKEVAPGYARNFLIPRKLVIVAKEGSTRALKHQKAVIARKTEKRKREMSGVAEELKKLDGLELKVRVGAKNKLFGSVTAMQIASAISEQGIPLDKRKVEIGDKIRALGNYSVKVRLAENITVPLGIKVVADESSIVEEVDFDIPEEARAAAERVDVRTDEEKAADRAKAEAEAAAEGDAAES